MKSCQEVPPVKLGSLLAKIGHEAGLTEEDIAVINTARDEDPPEPVSFD
jgi:hypothetical protein